MNDDMAVEKHSRVGVDGPDERDAEFDGERGMLSSRRMPSMRSSRRALDGDGDVSSGWVSSMRSSEGSCAGTGNGGRPASFGDVYVLPARSLDCDSRGRSRSVYRSSYI